MARRRSPGPDGSVNLDSLLDALTNVVAVLILVLVLVQADVSQKVTQFLDSLIPATPQQVAHARTLHAKLEQELQRKNALLANDTPAAADITEERRQLALLEKSIADKQKLLVAREALRKLHLRLELKRDIKQADSTELQTEIARLEAQLDATPVLKTPLPQIVTIPLSRAIPANADIYYALVFADRVHVIDPFTPLEEFQQEFRQHKRNWQFKRIKQQGLDRYIHDQVAIVEHFETFPFSNDRKQSLRIPPNPTGTRLFIEVKPHSKSGGSSIEELRQPNSAFHRAMDTLARKRHAVLIFHVHPNAFNTYLEARRVTDHAKVPAGWEVRGNTTHRIPIPEVEVQRLQAPPPPNPNPKPRPLPLKPTLD